MKTIDYAQLDNLQAIDASGYDKTLETDAEKLQFLRDTFIAEYGFNIKQVGEFKALTSWLQGLPSAISIAFYNHDILKLAQSFGSLPKNASMEQEDKILNNYFPFMAMR